MGILSSCKKNFKSGSVGKLDTNAVAYFTKNKSTANCNILGFAKSIVEDGKVLYSHRYVDKPEEKFCGLDRCDMTGVLFVTPDVPEEGEEVSTVVTTEIGVSGETFQYGYERFMIYGKAGDKFDVTIKNPGEKGGNKFNIVLKEDGWNAIVLELFTPDEVVDGGWIATDGPFHMVVEPKQETEFRLSTVEMFENAYELVRDQTIGFTCISDFSGDPALTLTENTCDIPVYDEAATTIERSITASNIIGDLSDFGPLTRRTDISEHTVQTTGQFVAKAETVEGQDYAVITLPDLAEVKCPAFLIQPQNCNYESLYHMNIDGTASNVEVPDDMYYREENKIFLSASYVDETFIIAYPITVSGTAWDITTDGMNDYSYSMEMVVPIKGEDWIIKADNVKVTGLPWTWTGEAGSLTIPYTMVRESGGKYGQMIKVDNRK